LLNLNVVIAYANIDKSPYIEGTGSWSKGVAVEQPDGFVQMIPFVGDRDGASAGAELTPRSPKESRFENYQHWRC